MDTTTDTDERLVALAGLGDQSALARLIDRHAPTLTRYAWPLVASRTDVEEIVQDTFVTLWERAGGLELRSESLLPWLLVTCRNHAMNLRRKRARAANDELPEDLAAPADRTEAQERLRWVRDEIDALPDVDRRICELCLLDGRTYSEAAAELGLSVGAVRQRVARSRARLKKAVMHDEH